MKAITPLILHPLVAQFVAKMSHNALKIALKIGESVFKANNRTVSTIRGKKDVKAAYVLVNREVLCEQCNITEKQWEKAVQELDELGILWVAERNTLKLDRYFMLVPNKHLIRKIVFYNRSTIPKTFRGNNSV